MAEKFMERERKALEKLMRREMPAKSHFQDPICALVKGRVLCKMIGVKTLIYTVKKNRNNSKNLYPIIYLYYNKPHSTQIKKRKLLTLASS